MGTRTSGCEVGGSPGSGALVAFARLTDAKFIGRSRFGTPNYNFNCPNHFERTPSGFATEDSEGRLLVKDWGGCSTKDILAALGLSYRDLYKDSRKVSPEETRQRDALRAAAEAWHDALVVVSREAFDYERKCELEMRRLGDAFANLSDGHPGGVALCQEFHRVCRRLAMAEMESQRLVAIAKRMHRPSGWQASASSALTSYVPAESNSTLEEHVDDAFVSSVRFFGINRRQGTEWI